MSNIAIIFAGGTGKRMNTKSKPKQFIHPIRGRHKAVPGLPPRNGGDRLKKKKMQYLRCFRLRELCVSGQDF